MSSSPKACKWCGRALDVLWPTKVYCNDACKQSAYYHRRKAARNSGVNRNTVTNHQTVTIHNNPANRNTAMADSTVTDHQTVTNDNNPLIRNNVMAIQQGATMSYGSLSANNPMNHLKTLSTQLSNKSIMTADNQQTAETRRNNRQQPAEATITVMGMAINRDWVTGILGAVPPDQQRDLSLIIVQTIIEFFPDLIGLAGAPGVTDQGQQTVTTQPNKHHGAADGNYGQDDGQLRDSNDDGYEDNDDENDNQDDDDSQNDLSDDEADNHLGYDDDADNQEQDDQYRNNDDLDDDPDLMYMHKLDGNIRRQPLLDGEPDDGRVTDRVNDTSLRDRHRSALFARPYGQERNNPGYDLPQSQQRRPSQPQREHITKPVTDVPVVTPENKRVIQPSRAYLDRFASPLISRGMNVWEEVALTVPCFMEGYILQYAADAGILTQADSPEDSGTDHNNPGNDARAGAGPLITLHLLFDVDKHRRPISRLLDLVLEAGEGRLTREDFEQGGDFASDEVFDEYDADGAGDEDETYTDEGDIDYDCYGQGQTLPLTTDYQPSYTGYPDARGSSAGTILQLLGIPVAKRA